MSPFKQNALYAVTALSNALSKGRVTSKQRYCIFVRETRSKPQFEIIVTNTSGRRVSKRVVPRGQLLFNTVIGCPFPLGRGLGNTKYRIPRGAIRIKPVLPKDLQRGGVDPALLVS